LPASVTVVPPLLQSTRAVWPDESWSVPAAEHGALENDGPVGAVVASWPAQPVAVARAGARRHMIERRIVGRVEGEFGDRLFADPSQSDT